MNISEAKKYIKDSVKIYLKKDEEGAYRIPLVRQRPVFLLARRASARRPLWSRSRRSLELLL